MREIKLKFWLGHTKKMTYEHELKDVHKVVPEFTPDIMPLQYTGLKDKNGKEIYEGDIFQYKFSEQGKQDEFDLRTERVIFHRGSFGFQEWNTDLKGNLKDRLIHHSAHMTTPDLYYINFDLEVIGNIHENKDLLN